MLKAEFNKEESDIRKTLSRHPHWCHVPSVTVKQSFIHLRRIGYSVEAIYSNIHILLYTVYVDCYLSQNFATHLVVFFFLFFFSDRINVQLKKLNSSNDGAVEEESSTNFKNLPEDVQLRLCIYYIEREFHFTGDGIWMETSNVQQTENFLPPVPELPVTLMKQYKYGRTPKVDRIF